MIIKEVKITLNEENEGDLAQLAESRDAEHEPVQILFDGKVAMAQFADDAKGEDGTFENLFAELLDADDNVASYVFFTHVDD